jgi:hypothetical protein
LGIAYLGRVVDHVTLLHQLIPGRFQREWNLFQARDPVGA